MMFFDPTISPPPAGGDDPVTPAARIGPAQERAIMRVIGVVLLVIMLAPFAGSSLIGAVVATVRSAWR